MEEELELPSDAPATPPAPEAEIVLPSDDPNMVLPSDAPPKSRPQHAAGIVTDIPSKIYEAGSQAVSGLNEAFNPYSDTQKALQKRQLDPNVGILDRMADEWDNIKTKGAGLLSVPALALSPLTGAARATVGNAFDAVAPRIDPEKAKQAGITPVTGDEVADLATMAIAPGKGGLRAIHGPPEPPPAAPLPPEKPPFGVTLTEGEQTGKLPLIQKEQAALRGKEILGEPAHEQAQMFAAQRKHELPAAKEGVAGELNPTPAIRAESPQAAADSITEILTQQHRAQEARTAQRTQQLQNAHNTFRQALGPQSGLVLAETPLEAANIIGGSITHANDAAKAATAAAYTTAREMPGKFPAASFNTLEAEIRGALARGEQPKLINPQQHPTTVSALGDIEDILSDLKQMRDPETGRVLPKPPNTMARVDLARQRLNTFLGDAIQTARNDSSAWKDVRAMEEVIDAFDNAVAKRLRKGQFIDGDAAAVDAAFKEARAAHADWAKKFKPQGAGDKVGPAIRDILGRHEGQAATPEAVSTFLYGSGDRPVFVAKRLKQIFGENSHEFGAARQGLYSHITEPPPGKTWTPEQLAANIDKYTRGAGRSLTEQYLTRPQINALQSFAEAQRVHARDIAATLDPADKAIAQLTGAGTGSAPSTQYAVQTLFNKALSNSKDAVAVIERLKQRLSPEQFGVYKEGLFRAAMDQGMGLEGFGHKKIADNLTKLANSQAGRAAYSLEQLELIRQFGVLHRKMVVPQAGANWSNTANTVATKANKVAEYITSAIGGIIGSHIGSPTAGMVVGYIAGKGLQKVAHNVMAKQIAKQMPLIADKVQAYNKALAAYNKSQNPLSARAQATAGVNLSRALEQIGIDPSKLQLPGVSSAGEDKEKKRAEGGAVEAIPFEESSLPREGFYDGRYRMNVAPGLQPLQATTKLNEPAAVEPAHESEVAQPQQLGPSTWHDPTTDEPAAPLDFGNRTLNRLTGAGGEERFQFWPEKMVRSAATLAGDVLLGAVPATTLRREDLTDLPEPDASYSAEKREGGFWPFNKLAPVAAQPSDELIGRTQDLAGVAGGTGFGAATTGAVPKGALGMIGGKGLVPAIKQGRKIWVGDKDMPFHSDVWEQKVVPDVGLKQADADGTIHGFVNEKGKFLTREQAAAYAEKNKLLTREGKAAVRDGYDDIDASDVRPGALFSDSGKPGAPLAALENAHKPFYSAVERAIEKAPQDKMTPQQWQGWLKNQPGIKGEELNWLGLGDNPRGITPDWKGTVTKDELLGHVKEHGVELKEVEKAGLPADEAYARRYARNHVEENHPEVDPGTPLYRDLIEEAEEAYLAEKSSGPRYGPGKYDHLSLPGGENYRELLVTLPKSASDKNAQALKDYGRAYADLPLHYQKIVDADAPGYTTRHWDEHNVVGHIRMNDRMIPDKNGPRFVTEDGGLLKSMHVEEFQSDWHQAGRKKGYKQPPKPLESTKGWTAKTEKENNYTGQRDVRVYDADGNFRGLASGTRKTDEEVIADFARSRAEEQPAGVVPDAPFKQSWPDMLLKRAISKAAREGYDSISWTPGEQQAARYDFSKQIDRVSYDPEKQQLRVYKDGRPLLSKEVTPDKLEAEIGKEVAKKLLEQPVKNDAEITTDGDPRKTHVLEGLDLKVGGEGMKAFYDKMLVDKANAIGKKFGAKVEWKELPSTVEDAMHQNMLKGKGVLVPVLRLTPELKAQALSGMPLFQDAGKPGAALSALEKGSKIKLRSLPEDMQVLLSQFAEDFGGKSLPETLTIKEVPTTALPQVELSKTDRGVKHAAEMDLDKTPPIVVANGHFLDGKHRLHRARELGRSSLPAVDLTGLLPKKSVLSNSIGKLSPNRAFGGSVLDDDDFEDERQEVPGPEPEEPDDDEDDEPQFRALGGRVEASNINHAPTEAQKHVGNYAKDHVNIHGLKIAIENARGSKRRGVDKNGEPWECKVPCNYGYIKGTHGADDDHVDVYLGPHIKAPHVFVLDQVDKDSKKFDEHKVGIGFGSKVQFINTYKSAFSDGKGKDRIGAVAELTLHQFKSWLKHGDTKQPLGWGSP